MTPLFQPLHLIDFAEPIGYIPFDIGPILIKAGLVRQMGARLCLLARSDISHCLEDARQILHRNGRIGPPRGELMPVYGGFDGPAIGRIDRSALRIFGLWATKVHINGIVGNTSDERAIWISRRSDRSNAAPGTFDTMVAGGQALGQTALEAARKEAWEEAGLKDQELEGLVHIHDLPVVYTSDQGLHQERLAIYDLALPEGLVPSCRDGEIVESLCLSQDELQLALGGTLPFKSSSWLVCRDLLMRLEN